MILTKDDIIPDSNGHQEVEVDFKEDIIVQLQESIFHLEKLKDSILISDTLTKVLFLFGASYYDLINSLESVLEQLQNDRQTR